jgi:hypothetical protein
VIGRLRLFAIASALAVGPAAGLAAGNAASLGLASQELTVYRTCTITATPATTTAVIDATVRQGAPAGNFGTAVANHVTSRGGTNRRLYLWFDLSVCSPAIPSSADIRLATLRVFVSALSTACRTIDVFRVTSAWTETGLTWANQPMGTSINNPPGASATDTFTVGTPVGCENSSPGVYSVGANPTADVAAFVAGTATNHGWMLRDDVEGSGTARTETIAAKELGSILQAPQLVITYVTVP